jgi:hypothetical protein
MGNLEYDGLSHHTLWTSLILVIIFCGGFLSTMPTAVILKLSQIQKVKYAQSLVNIGTDILRQTVWYFLLPTHIAAEVDGGHIRHVMRSTSAMDILNTILTVM